LDLKTGAILVFKIFSSWIDLAGDCHFLVLVPNLSVGFWDPIAPSSLFFFVVVDSFLKNCSLDLCLQIVYWCWLRIFSVDAMVPDPVMLVPRSRLLLCRIVIDLINSLRFLTLNLIRYVAFSCAIVHFGVPKLRWRNESEHTDHIMIF
jgi:hypothetical protein